MSDSKNDRVKKFFDTYKPLNDLLFANLRNNIVCGSLGIAGIVVAKSKCIAIFGQPTTSWIGYFLVIISIVLMVSNVLFGCVEIFNQYSTSNSKRTAVALFSLGAACYLILGSTFLIGFVSSNSQTSFSTVCTKLSGSP